MAIDLQQFHEVFFIESLEGLDVMEQALLTIEDGVPLDPETINTIFRSAHSIKGGSGTFGFSDIADFTHVLETLLDEARDGKRTLGSTDVDLLLKSCDCLREMVVSLQNGQPIDSNTAQPLILAFEAMLKPSGNESNELTTETASQSDTSSAVHSNEGWSDDGSSDHLSILEESFNTLLNDDALPATSSQAVPEDSDQGRGDIGEGKRWKIVFHPEPQILMTGNEPLRIFRELAGLGELETEADTRAVPEFEQLSVDECFIRWTLWLRADVSRDDILEVFDWVIDECTLEISLEGAELSAQEETSEARATELQETSGNTIKEANQYAAGSAQDIVEPDLQPDDDYAPIASSAKPLESKTEGKGVAPGTPVGTASIRVGIDKVDSLINLVGELVITQSMLSELGNDFTVDKLERLSNGLEQLQQNTRELQESVMRIRMLPISFAFNRFPRMIRDLSSKTGKKVNLKLSGEHTELDKTVMEQIGDPLVHLVRNAIDHGVELPEKRRAAGKEETGTIYLDAYHKGGNIVIEISDDGNGIDPAKVLRKAKEKGVVAAEAELSDHEIYNLIFEPGFSTAEVVSDISGRGVGMDVVRRNIMALGGRIEVESELGKGSTFRVHLPLTLAILDGQLVRVGSQVYIVPLVSIVESLQIKPELVNQVAGNMTLYRLREDNVPVIPIYQMFGIEAENTQLANGLLVVVEGDGEKIGLLVDDLLAQQQIVIKSLESNYKRVEGISGATILGDGSVSMILDIPGLIRLASEKTNQNEAA